MAAEAQLLQDQKNMLFSSTVINYGSAIGVVVYTGMNTAIGRVQQEVAGAAREEEDTPLKKKLDAFGELLSKIIAIICFLVWAMNFNNFFDKLAGTTSFKNDLIAGLTENQIRQKWKPGITNFKKLRKPYLLYPDLP